MRVQDAIRTPSPRHMKGRLSLSLDQAAEGTLMLQAASAPPPLLGMASCCSQDTATHPVSQRSAPPTDLPPPPGPAWLRSVLGSPLSQGPGSPPASARQLRWGHMLGSHWAQPHHGGLSWNTYLVHLPNDLAPRWVRVITGVVHEGGQKQRLGRGISRALDINSFSCFPNSSVTSPLTETWQAGPPTAM